MVTIKRVLNGINTVITYAALAFLVLAGVSGSITGKPLFLTAVRSGSMSPTLERGDMVLLWPIGWTEPRIGDIVVFEVSAGSLRSAGWVIHRAVDGDPDQGFITQGDNNDATDQQRDANPPIRPGEMAARAVMLGGRPIRVPYLGYLPLWAETMVARPYVLPGAAILVLTLAFAAHAAGPRRRSRSRRRRRGGGEPFVYLLGGVSLFVLVAAAGLLLSQQFAFTYTVSAEGRAAITGSAIGQLLVGDEVSRPLTTVNNGGGRLPLVLAVSSSDSQVRLSSRGGILRPGEEQELSMRIVAQEVGEHRAHIWVGLFYPILPAGVVQAMAARSYWLALAVVSFMPALPVFLIPLLDEHLRRQLLGAARRGVKGMRLPRISLWSR